VAPGGGAAAVPGKGFRERALSLDQPLLQQQQPDRVGLGGGGGGGAAGGGAGGGEEEEEEEVEQQQAPVVAAVVLPLPGYVKPPVPQAVGDKPVLLAEQNKADMQADEFGEQNRQLPGAVPPRLIWACSEFTWLVVARRGLTWRLAGVLQLPSL